MRKNLVALLALSLLMSIAGCKIVKGKATIIAEKPPKVEHETPPPPPATPPAEEAKPDLNATPGAAASGPESTPAPESSTAPASSAPTSAPDTAVSSDSGTSTQFQTYNPLPDIELAGSLLQKAKSAADKKNIGDAGSSLNRAMFLLAVVEAHLPEVIIGTGVDRVAAAMGTSGAKDAASAWQLTTASLRALSRDSVDDVTRTAVDKLTSALKSGNGDNIRTALDQVRNLPLLSESTLSKQLTGINDNAAATRTALLRSLPQVAAAELGCAQDGIRALRDALHSDRTGGGSKSVMP